MMFSANNEHLRSGKCYYRTRIIVELLSPGEYIVIHRNLVIRPGYQMTFSAKN